MPSKFALTLKRYLLEASISGAQFLGVTGRGMELAPPPWEFSEWKGLLVVHGAWEKARMEKGWVQSFCRPWASAESGIHVCSSYTECCGSRAGLYSIP